MAKYNTNSKKFEAQPPPVSYVIGLNMAVEF